MSLEVGDEETDSPIPSTESGSVPGHALGTFGDYELLTGRPPFHAETAMETLRQVVEQEIRRPSSMNRRVDRDLETICLKCLRKDPLQRYGSAAALAEDCERWLRREPIQARPATVAERMLKLACRHPTRMGLLVLGMLTPAVVIGVLLVAEGNLRRERNNALEHERKARIAAAGADITARNELRVWDLVALQSMPLDQPQQPPAPEFFSEDSRTLFARGEVTSEGLLPLMRRKWRACAGTKTRSSVWRFHPMAEPSPPAAAGW